MVYKISRLIKFNYCTAPPPPICIHFSQLSTRLPASSPASTSSTTSSTSCATTCTGYQSVIASNSSCAHKSASVSTVRPTCASQCRRHPVTLICVLPFTVTSSFHGLCLARYGPRGFVVSGPVTWNSLPPDLSDTSLSAASFFIQLKTELFIRAYYITS